MHTTDHDRPSDTEARAEGSASEICEKRRRIADLLGGLLARQWLEGHTHAAADAQTTAPDADGASAAPAAD